MLQGRLLRPPLEISRRRQLAHWGWRAQIHRFRRPHSRKVHAGKRKARKVAHAARHPHGSANSHRFRALLAGEAAQIRGPIAAAGAQKLGEFLGAHSLHEGAVAAAQRVGIVALQVSALQLAGGISRQRDLRLRSSRRFLLKIKVWWKRSCCWLGR